MNYTTRVYLFIIILTSFTACTSTRKYELDDGAYKFRQKGMPYQKADVYIKEDSISIYSSGNSQKQIIPNRFNDQFFLKHSFDLDVMTVAFKYRHGTPSLPRQLTTDFNGNAFVGYRLDRFRLRTMQTPIGLKKRLHHRAITLGAFGGLGTTAINPWTTRNRTTDEYNSLILTEGLAVMVGLNDLTVGLGIGWDHLTDRDKNIWIYQNIPWLGLTVGLNIN